MYFLFGLSLPSGQPIDRELATLIAGRITTAATSLKQGGSAAVTAQVRGDAQRYLDARRSGAIRFAPGAGRACDEGAWALMRLTVDAPPVRATPALLVA
ncbi:MAG: hypothetical protein ACXWZS_03040 [Gemmatirosa sp.]